MSCFFLCSLQSTASQSCFDYQDALQYSNSISASHSYLGLARVTDLPTETRSLDETYTATEYEDGRLVVVWGGDGKCFFEP